MRSRTREGRGTPPTSVAAARMKRELRRQRIGTRGQVTPVQQSTETPRLTDIPEGAPAGDLARPDDLVGELNRRRDGAVARVAELAAEMEKEISGIGDIDNVLSMFVPCHERWQGAGLRPQVTGGGEDGYRPPFGHPGSGRDVFFGSDDRSAVIISILRGATRPLTSTEVTGAYIDRKGVTLDASERTRVTSRISAILSRLRERGIVAHLDNGERVRTWFLI